MQSFGYNISSEGGGRMPQKPKATKLEFTFKSDVLFKMLFLQYPNLLKNLIAVLLAIPLDSISKFEITNTEMPPAEIGKKFCRLDINMIVNGSLVNLEIQINDEGNYPERVLFHWSKMYSAALPSGDDYKLLPKTIIISILGFKLFDCQEVHSEFGAVEVNRHTRLTDKLSLHFFELPKLQDVTAIDTTNEKDLWLALFNAETEEELEKISETGGAVMNEAIQAYHSVTATEEFRNLEWMRQKAAHDEAQALANARRQRDEFWQGVAKERDTAVAERNAIATERDTIATERDTIAAERDIAFAEIKWLRQQITRLTD